MGPEKQEAFDIIIEKLTSQPVLVYADYTKPFMLNIDGAVMVLVPYFTRNMMA